MGVQSSFSVLGTEWCGFFCGNGLDCLGGSSFAIRSSFLGEIRLLVARLPMANIASATCLGLPVILIVRNPFASRFWLTSIDRKSVV